MFDWVVSIPYGQDKVRSTSAVDRKLGTMGMTPDGRLFRWCFSNGAVTAGKLLATPIFDVNHDMDLSPQTAFVVGDRSVSLTVGRAQIEVDDFEDGFVSVNDGTPGEGHMYAIKTHPLILTGATGVFTLWEQVRVALATTGQVALIPNHFKHVVINPATQTQRVIGATPTDISDNEYFWAQVRGPASILVGTTTDNMEIGRMVVPAVAVDGSIEGMDWTNDREFREIGTAMGVISVDGDYQSIWLSIE